MKLNVKITGIDDLVNMFDKAGSTAALKNAEKVTETYTRKMANEAAAMAPKKDYFLTNSIASSPEPIEKGVWSYGSNLPYANRQEYEHISSKGFFRRSMWNNRQDYRNALQRIITEGLLK